MGLTSSIRDADAIYFGSTEADKVYAGSELLYEGTFDPTSIDNLALWLDAGQGTSTTTDGVAVSQWNDQSGNGRNAIQGTAGKRPLYKTSVVNGRPVMRFDGTDDALTSTFAITGVDRTFFVVGKSLDAASSLGRFAGHGGAVSILDNAGRWAWYSTATFGILNLQAGTTARTGFSVVVARVTGSGATTITGRVNGGGGSFTSGSALASADPSWAATDFNIGSGGPSDYLPCDIAEVVVYGSHLSATDVGRVEAHLGTKYGVTIA